MRQFQNHCVGYVYLFSLRPTETPNAKAKVLQMGDIQDCLKQLNGVQWMAAIRTWTDLI